jgi:hypothetical protein
MRVGAVRDACCKQCAVHSGRGAHDADCSGVADDASLLEFEESLALDHLMPSGATGLRSAAAGAAAAPAAPADSSVGAKRECGICFDDLTEDDPVLCQMGHSFCRNCMGRHIAEELEGKGVLPACPLSAQCHHVLTRDQVEEILPRTDDRAMRRFDLLAQRSALQALGAVPCARDACQDWIVPPRASGQPQLVVCPSCQVRFCSSCKRRPFHFRIDRCADVLAVDNAWHEWLRRDRDVFLARRAAEDVEYQKVVQELSAKKAEQDKMLEEAESRKREFEEMEDWKARNCKCCPHCRRVINKIDGCDSMVCGRNYHGGDAQDGCGREFKWSAAPAYTRQTADHVPAVRVERLDPAPAGREKQYWECDPGTYLRCAMCKDAVEGPLFLCVDCLACCACLRCANGLGSAAGGQHLPDSHVFSIKWNFADLQAKDLENLKRHHLTTKRKHRRGEALSPEETLQDMGFSLERSRAALAAANGDVSQALQRLVR